jgi:hypothetical protein
MAAAKKVKARLLARMSVIIPRMVIPDELREGLGGGTPTFVELFDFFLLSLAPCGLAFF